MVEKIKVNMFKKRFVIPTEVLKNGSYFVAVVRRGDKEYPFRLIKSQEKGQFLHTDYPKGYVLKIPRGFEGQDKQKIKFGNDEIVVCSVFKESADGSYSEVWKDEVRVCDYFLTRKAGEKIGGWDRKLQTRNRTLRGMLITFLLACFTVLAVDQGWLDFVYRWIAGLLS